MTFPECDCGLLKRDWEHILATLAAFPEVERAYLFGSRAMGNFRRGSDVDLALEGAGVSTDLAWKIRRILNEEKPLPYFFDVVDYTHLKDPSLRSHIDRVKVLVYEKVPSSNP